MADIYKLTTAMFGREKQQQQLMCQQVESYSVFYEAFAFSIDMRVFCYIMMFVYSFCIFTVFFEMQANDKFK